VDLQPQDLRRRFLEYAANSRAYVENLNRAIDAAESPFEREVIRRLLAKGYRLYPQFQVGAYRIDIVVEGAAGKRLAVECDGDRWHGLDKTQGDLERQNLLERLGWRFHRIRGGSFYRDPEAEMVKLEAALADRDIAPAQTMGDPAEGGPTLAEQVTSRSSEILAAWKAEDGLAVDRPATPARDTSIGGERQPKVVPPTPPERRVAAGADPDIDAEDDSTDERPAAPVRAAAGTVANHAAALLAHLGSTWLSRAELLAMVSLSVPQWNLAIHDLVESGRVEARGDKGGRRYRLAGVTSTSGLAAPLLGGPNTGRRLPESNGAPPPARRNDPESGANTLRDPVKAALRAADPRLSSARCPECESHCELFVGKRGPFLKCQNHMCEDTSPIELATLERAVAANPSWRCGRCGGSLRVLEQPTRTLLECSSRHQEAWQAFRDRVRGGGMAGAQPVHAPTQLRLLRGGVAEDDDAD
jgi:very-short-patch-repair endonuclease